MNGEPFTDPPSTPLVDPPRPPPLVPYGRAGVWCACRGGVKAPRGGSEFTDPPSTPLVDPPRPLHYCTSYRLIGRGGLAENQRGVKAPRGLQRPAQLTPTGRWPTFGMHRPCRCRCAPGNVAAFRSTSSRTRPLEWPRADSRRPLLRAAPKAGGDERFWDV